VESRSRSATRTTRSSALGPDETPYEFVLAERIARDDVWRAVLQRIRSLLTAVVRGRYRRERILTHDGRLVLVRGTFELPDGNVTHLARSLLSFFRRKRREPVLFEPY
jgi:hypothetical protein